MKKKRVKLKGLCIKNANFITNLRMSSREVLTASGRLHARRSTGSGGTGTLEIKDESTASPRLEMRTLETESGARGCRCVSMESARCCEESACALGSEPVKLEK